MDTENEGQPSGKIMCNSRAKPSRVDIVYTLGLVYTLTAMSMGVYVALGPSPVFSANLSVPLTVKGDAIPYSKVDVFFYLFRTGGDAHLRNGTLQYFPHIKAKFGERETFGAQAIFLLGEACCGVSLLIHFMVVVVRITRKWFVLLTEMSLLLSGVLALVISLALCETKMRKMDMEGDSYLHSVLEELKLSPKDQDLTLKVHGPTSGYWFLVAADLILLAGLVACVPQFIKITEKEEEMERYRKESQARYFYR